jgi:aminoglycoside phosphotransferase (APT) family kinase protein
MADVRQIHGGWGSLTFLVDDHILRFARTAEVAQAHRGEAALLPLLARTVSFRVPEPDFFGTWGAASTLMGYPLIEGRQFTSADDWRSLASGLRELHAVPVGLAKAALGGTGTVAEWRASYEELRIERVLPALDAAVADRLTSSYADFLAGNWDFQPVLVHRDLASEHILVDDAGTLVGLIDFEDATIGDPAIDFAGLLTVLGHDRTEELITEYGGPVDRDRLRCYWWLAPVHDLLHGLATRDSAITAEAMTTLRERLA